MVAQLIDSLDEIQLLAGGRKDDILFLQWLFEIPSLYSLLEVLYCQILLMLLKNSSFPALPVLYE